MWGFNNIDNENKLLQFCKHHEQTYLYGAGAYGEIVYYYLKKNNVNVIGFITTDNDGEYIEKKVYKADGILPKLNEESGVILSIREELQDEILSSQNFCCDIYRPSDVELLYLDIVTTVDGELLTIQKNQLVDENKILVVQLEVTFGDMIWSTAFLRELKRNFPYASIDYLINEKFVGLYKNCPYINRIYEYECSSITDRFSNQIVDKVKSYIKSMDINYSMAFLPRLLPLSLSDVWENVLIPMYLGIPQIYGHALYFLEAQKCMCDFFSQYLTGIVKHDVAFHETVHDLKMLSLIDAKIENDRMELWPSRNLNIGSSDSIKICVALVGSIPSRSWSPEKYGAVFNGIFEKYSNVEIILCGGNDAVGAAEKVVEKTRGRCINLTGKTTLDEVVSVFSECDIYLGSDTGLMHVASAFNLYVIEISASNKTSPKYWGCTPIRTGPWCDDYSVLQPDKPLDNCKYMCFKPYAHCINQVSEDNVLCELQKAILIVRKRKGMS